jgi:16S rRNA U516 pseudouridylate synthase RsuA-like enzyme
MSFYRRIKYFLVHTLMKTNFEAQALISRGAVQIDGEIIFENCFITDQSEIKVNGKIERKKKEFVYLKFNKPIGYESQWVY